MRRDTGASIGTGASRATFPQGGNRLDAACLLDRAYSEIKRDGARL